MNSLQYVISKWMEIEFMSKVGRQSLQRTNQKTGAMTNFWKNNLLTISFASVTDTVNSR